ncbi:unnamed protein product [Kuraishia capsulata CBS 1993]|uniref:J domain-containing protein n=1 Tax=Kuraishia capsulata CBS 1993 TaxID=1382522 RepID=W6MT06_9ASCO|nr:uncharacterized protein KUCA_T00005853001 [Kuraishia capsulata CBS 1993]CDK29859.1 unnamed protein product [Kuraishia capsulata CBS 1993]
MSSTLPAPASAASPSFKAAKTFSPAVRRPIEPVGRYFLAHALRASRGHSWSEYEKIEAEKNVKTVDTSVDEDDFDEEQSEELLKHDPRDWKSADLYAVLGLTKYRWRATPEQITKAHRKQVLKHHPDKKGEAGGLDQDGFFKIIQKAYETMLDPTKRQQFDSVDFNADVEVPPAKSTYDFFEAWGPAFEAEGRFSKKQPVPALGDMTATKPEVDAFYAFWYNFDSWRSFEFLDEDVPDDTANRDHKRYIERKNKAARQKKKNEDNKRLAELVKRALSEDPRIKLFKQQEKDEKARKKWEREAGARQAAEEAKLKQEAEEKAKAEAELNAKASKENSKKAKEAAKNAKKKNKRSIRASVKDVDYFGEAAQADAITADVDILIETFDDLQLGDVAAKVGGVTDVAAVKTAFSDAAKEQVAAGKVSASSLKYFV